MSIRQFLIGLTATAVLPGAELRVVEVSRVPVPEDEGFQMGTSQNPDGGTIGINARYLTRDGKPWMPVMGEFHFSRCPAAEWREELLRMKAGGIDIAASYVFWNHHEEVEGEWDWSGRRNLREFVRLCGETGMLAAIRVGPWCHGEVRNGGVPDWALEKEWKLRSEDPAYLEHVRRLYGQVSKQLEGQLWKDGGPVVAIQVENEYRGHGGHLMHLKEIAREVGLDVPLYTRTGWPALASPVPFGEIAPLFGAYAEGFWDRKLRSMPGKYWAAFRFMETRTDAAIATEQLGERAIRDEEDANRYPYLTCELGGGMMSSYHRRIRIQPEDIEAVALVKVGSGGNLPGYYMYHGGVNPEGRLTTLNEAQATPMTNYNDMPVKNYDFQAPLGSLGQTRGHYHRLRRLHLLCRDFGGELATMPSFLPEKTPGEAGDTATLRWAVRSDGDAGFLFVNNHQRGAELPAHEDVQFVIRGGAEERRIPSEPCKVGPGLSFVWPYRLDLGGGLRLEHASAQLICRCDEEGDVTLFFAETPGVPAEFVLSDGSRKVLEPGRGVGMRVTSAAHEVRIVLLDDADSLALWKGAVAGRERVVLSRADVLFDREGMRLRAENPEHLVARVFPPLSGAGESDGVFESVRLDSPDTGELEVGLTSLRQAGPAREVRKGKQGVAEAPGDGDFENAAAWEITLPADFDPSATNALLRISYRGDVARVKVGDRLVMDDFYNGSPLELGLKRHAGAIESGERIVLEVLPMRADAPIFLPDKPEEGTLLELDSVRLVPRLSGEIPSR